MKILRYKDMNESLPSEASVKQLKKLRNLTKGIDIGDKLPDNNNLLDSNIESYEDYIKNNKITESATYDYGCVMLDINIENWNNILDMIDVSDLTDDGLVEHAHITLLYGLHSDVSIVDVKEALSKLGKKLLKINTNKISIFENDEYDVVKFEVELNDDLIFLNNELSKLPNSNTFPDYKPHITIAYVKKGAGKKYVKNYQMSLESSDITYSLSNGREIKFSLYDIKSINENKMFYKDIDEMLKYIGNLSNNPLLFVDVETTGLGGSKKQQLTQISGITINYDINSNQYTEMDKFDQKIKLTDEIKNRFKEKNDKTKWVLGFNHYGDGDYKYRLEFDVVEEYFNWISKYSPCVLIAQNAIFDMNMLCGRFNHKNNNEVFDTKMLIQMYFIPIVQKLAETDDYYKKLIDKIGTSTRDFGLISSSLSKIGPALDINMSNYHDSLTDCLLTIEMFTKIIDIMKKNRNLDITKYQIDRIKAIRSQS